MRRFLIPVLLAVAFASGCAVNPVTGKKELQFVSEPQEIALGVQNYAPSRQMQGGDYVLDPALTQYVQQVGNRLAAASDRPDLPYEFAVINNSVPNAWALPGGKIAINRGLMLEMGSEAELAAVMGHEIVHAAARHGAKSMERGLLLQGALVALQLSAQDNRYANFIVGGAQVGAMLLSQKYGRNAELESDYYGMRYMADAGYHPGAAVDLQETFVRLSENRQTDWLSGLFASHPPSMTRVEKNQETAIELAATGEYGRERYQRAIATLVATKPAYDKYDEAIKLANENQVDQAAALAQEAAQMEPREAKFHSLLGDIAAHRKDYRTAISHYNTAVAYNPQFFQTYLGRGLTYEAINDLAPAEEDLKRSIALLPTAPAHMALGSIAERRGRIDEAKQHYAMASQSQSDVGQAASRELVRLDLPTNPGQYVQTRLQVDAQGRVGVAVGNASPVAISDVEVLVSVLDPTGSRIQQSRPFRINRVIGANQQLVIDTGLGPVTDQEQLRRIRVEVQQAAIAE
ncbi:MAG: M48 family metalloprotease [Gammaproteobacteria bacterium]|nr:M48 family metalloprotease [Gammaproteobacteria bacterium]NNF62334.1 M48 family metalloprotease [Gammaproteobacteria bacterium]NNM21006.1 M48 family metalloprotease [Gammaproteobacteria bacterium]